VRAQEFHWSVRLGQQEYTTQNAQNGCPARPQRVKSRAGTDRTVCGPFAPSMDLGERKIASSASDLREALLNGEPLSDARTKHGERRVSAHRGRAGENSEFFSILLGVT
jgi:hypothetical protein